MIRTIVIHQCWKDRCWFMDPTSVVELQSRNCLEGESADCFCTSRCEGLWRRLGQRGDWSLQVRGERHAQRLSCVWRWKKRDLFAECGAAGWRTVGTQHLQNMSVHQYVEFMPNLFRICVLCISVATYLYRCFSFTRMFNVSTNEHRLLFLFRNNYDFRIIGS